MSLTDIQTRLSDAARKAGRDPADVTLVAVSKVQPDDRVQAVLDAGQRCVQMFEVSRGKSARAQFLVSYGIQEACKDGTGIIVTDLATMYQSESFFPEMLRFEVGLMDFNKYGGDFVFRVTKAESGQPVALAKYGFVFFNYHRKEVVPVPESFRSRFA